MRRFAIHMRHRAIDMDHATIRPSARSLRLNHPMIQAKRGVVDADRNSTLGSFADCLGGWLIRG
jgi:hypothetical protein